MNNTIQLYLNRGIKLVVRNARIGLIYCREMTFADTNDCNALTCEDGWSTGKGHSKQALTLQDTSSLDDTAKPVQ